jgi:ADP-ribosyl-[dinitrogen reductase] hydrolase
MYTQIYYTLLGGWCADAAGARLEFRQRLFTEQESIDAMHFVGDKTNGIPEGQFTDDSEMELCLLQGLIKGKNEEEFPIEKIAEEYIQWHLSNPFDIGITTRFALLDAKNADDMVNNAFEYNEDSESNGSLMRCIPIAIFCINKPDEIIMEVAGIDASLTHYSKRVQLITGSYCCIISSILRFKMSNNIININDLLCSIHSLCSKDEKILEWFNYALGLENLNNYDCVKNEGHVKHAFTLFIFFLKNIKAFTYEKAIIEVFKCGGDTDTNGKIIGNLFGAYYGDCVPSYMSEPVLKFDCTKAPKYFRRPSNYGIKNALKLIQDI